MKQITTCLLSLHTITAAAQIEVTPEDAAKHLGDSVSVCSKVFGGIYLGKSTGQPTMLNIEAAYPNNPFTAVIFDSVRTKFKDKPEVYFKNSHVCVTGKVELYKGKPQIVIQKPEQINPINQIIYSGYIPASQGDVYYSRNVL